MFQQSCVPNKQSRWNKRNILPKCKRVSAIDEVGGHSCQKQQNHHSEPSPTDRVAKGVLLVENEVNTSLKIITNI